MRIIEIEASPNGGHLNQTSNDIIPIPDGYITGQRNGQDGGGKEEWERWCPDAVFL